MWLPTVGVAMILGVSIHDASTTTQWFLKCVFNFTSTRLGAVVSLSKIKVMLKSYVASNYFSSHAFCWLFS